MATPQMPPVKYEVIKLQGGLDQVTPTLSLRPGVARRAANFECSVNGGYTRIAGYERFDGRPSPSAATYTILACTLTGAVAIDDALVGVTSAATAKVIAIDGSRLIVTREVGAFLANESIEVGMAPVGVVDEIFGVSPDGFLDATYRNLAADDYRADIQAVPGTGPILGVAYYNGTVYAWRNNSADTEALLYESSGSGWQVVDLGYELRFDTGTAEIFAGDTVTGATSGATGVVSRVVVQDGSWASTDAEGRLILSVTTGTFQTGESLEVAAAPMAIGRGTADAITLAKDGRYETVIANFGGGVANYRLYGCDGKNRAFEFDGTVFVPIETGMTADTPDHVAFHKQHLFLSFGASLQFSALGDPYQWTPLLGAGELAMNAPVTNLIALPGDQTSGALGVYTRRDTSVLYGSDSQDFQLAAFNTGTGAIAYTAQNMDQAYVLGDRGIMSLGTTLNFGNFLPASLTMNLRPFLTGRLTLAVGSTVSREKGQYRVFFSDGTALYMTMVNGKLLGTMPIQFGNKVTCVDEGESPQGTARIFFGSDNGFVYELDVGTSFDGAVISANITLVFNAIGSSRVLKRFRKGSVEMTGDAYAEIDFGYDLGYRTTEIDQPSDASYENDLRSVYWDSFAWDAFVWDGKDISPSEVEMNGTAENLAIRISSVSELLKPFTVNSVIVHYTPRRGLR